MDPSPDVTIKLFEKARAIERGGTLLAVTHAFGVSCFLYLIQDYFVEVMITSDTRELLGIKATVQNSIMDWYLDEIDISTLFRP